GGAEAGEPGLERLERVEVRQQPCLEGPARLAVHDRGELLPDRLQAGRVEDVGHHQVPFAVELGDLLRGESWHSLHAFRRRSLSLTTNSSPKRRSGADEWASLSVFRRGGRSALLRVGGGRGISLSAGAGSLPWVRGRPHRGWRD